MHRRAALTITGAIALTIAAGSAAMAANLGILDGDNGVDVGDLSPVGSSSSISTPNTVDDHGVDITPNTVGTTTPNTVGTTTPNTVDDHGGDTTPNTVGTTTPNTVDDHGGDTDHSGPGRDGDTDEGRSGRGGGDDHSGSGGGGGDDSGPGSSDD